MDSESPTSVRSKHQMLSSHIDSPKNTHAYVKRDPNSSTDLFSNGIQEDLAATVSYKKQGSSLFYKEPKMRQRGSSDFKDIEEEEIRADTPEGSKFKNSTKLMFHRSRNTADQGIFANRTEKLPELN
jgi:hypothetical protein